MVARAADRRRRARATTFSLRGLVRAGRDVQRALASDTAAARASLSALVSRSPDLDPPLIVSATIESLAENLTDSVVSPLLYYALFGLPRRAGVSGGQHDGRHAGLPRRPRVRGQGVAARSDDAANWLPTRFTGLLLVAVSALKGRGRPRLVGVPHAAPAAARTQQDAGHRDDGGQPWRAVAEAGGGPALGTAERALTGDVIDDAVWRVWAVGGATVVLAAGLAALLTWAVWG